MEYFDIPLKDDLWSDFTDLLKKSEIFTDYKSYFKTLVEWVKKYKNYIYHIDPALLANNRLVTILDIDIEKYLSKSPEISLAMETKRIFSERPETLNELLMGISNTLWDLVRFDTGEDCPWCMDASVNYVLAEVSESKQKKIILQCNTCTYEANLDKSEYVDGLAKIYPANEEDLREYILLMLS